MPPPLKILVLEDNPLDTELMLRELHRMGFEPDWLRVDNEKDYLQHLHDDLDLILSDFQMPQFNGLRALELLKERGFDIPFILISGTIGEDTAVEAMKQGAADYLLKDRLTRLGSAIQHALEQSRLRKERKVAMETLRLQETALNAVSQGVLICDENRLIIYANSSFTKLCGYAESEILGHNCSLLQGQDTDPKTIMRIRNALNAGEVFEGEILNYRKNGQTFWNELSIAPLRGGQDAPLRFIGIQRDVSERKLNEESLRRKETELRVLFDLMPAMIWFKDTTNNHLRVNKRAAGSIGKSVQEIEGRPARDFYPKEADAFYKADLEVIRSGMPRLGIVERIQDTKGQYLWMQTDKVPYCDKNGTVIGIVVMAQDITERKRAEERLATNESLLRQFIEHTPAAIAMLDTKMRYLQVSERWAEDYHLASREIIGKNHYEIFPEIPQRWKDIHQRVLAGAVERCDEDPFPRADGTIDWLQWEARPWYKAGGEIGGLIFFTQVITERKQAELEVRFNEQRYRSLVEATTAIVWDTPASGEFAVEQPRWSAFTGQCFEELRGWGWLNAIHPEDRENTARVWSAAVSSRRPYEVEHRLLAADNTYRNMMVRAVPILAEDGTIRQWIGIHMDITVQRRIELALRESKHFAESIAENSTSVIYLFDYKTRRTVYVNCNAAAALGYSQAEILEMGENFLPKLMHPEDLPRILQQGAHFAEASEGQVFDLEVRMRHVSGEWRWFWTRETIFDRNPDGTPSQIMGTAQDITERKKAEKRLFEALAQEKELSRKARAGDRAKGEFLAVMSHEIRTPLNGILGFSELLSKTPGLPAESRDYVETITSSGEALLRILNDVLDYSRLEAGQVQIEKTCFSPRELLGDIGALLSPKARDKGLVFGVSIDESISEHLAGDAGRLRQILLNLTGNALKFTESGSVTLELYLMPGTQKYRFSVKDTGCGISSESVDQLFQPFTQADSSISRRHGGSGLGLSISRSLAELLGGTLTVKSEPGKGSEFILAVPLEGVGPSSNLAPQLQKLDSSFAAAHPLRILIVEDDEVNLKLMLSLIRRLGYAPNFAKNGCEALEKRKSQAPDCMLMDLQMPEMDGVEATKRIRAWENASSPDTPVFILAVTANIVPADRQRCFDAGMNSYLNKPVRLAALATVLKEAENFVAPCNRDA